MVSIWPMREDLQFCMASIISASVGSAMEGVENTEPSEETGESRVSECAAWVRKTAGTESLTP